MNRIQIVRLLGVSLGVLLIILMFQQKSVTTSSYQITTTITHNWYVPGPVPAEPRETMHQLSDLYSTDGYFHKMLKAVADDKRRIFLASVDAAYVTMAINLLETSYWKHNITNYVFVCSDSDAYRVLAKHGVECLVFEQSRINTKESSQWNTKGFVQKTHIKTKVTYAALRLGYTVIITDVDVVFLRDPLMHPFCTDCDIEMTSDSLEQNSGFYIAHPTAATLKLHEESLKSAESTTTSNQRVINAALKKMKAAKTIKEKTLSKESFPNGLMYFEGKIKRYFAGDSPCEKCLIVHNNWILGQRAKIYRFKEHLMWLVDDDGYYSDPNRKYMTYNNNHNWGEPKTSQGIERTTLKHALAIAHILNRTLVLPKFTCPRGPFDIRCPLNSVVNIKTLDQHLGSVYREYTFFENPKVPDKIKESGSKHIFIRTEANKAVAGDIINDEQILIQSTPDLTPASPADIHTWFSTKAFRDIDVLTFHSLYHSFTGIQNHAVYGTYAKVIDKGVTPGFYRQFNEDYH